MANEAEVSMKLRILLMLSFLALSGLALAAPQPAAPFGQGLVNWLSKNLDEVDVRPGTDLAAYRKVMIDPAQVSMQKGWLKSINQTRDVSRWLVPADQKEITDNMTESMNRVVADTFRSRGYEVVSAPGPGVLRLTPSVVDLWLNAPDVPSANLTREFSVDTADATLNLDARDSVSGELLAKVIDRSTAREIRRINYTSKVSNLFWMDALFRQWTGACIVEFEASSGKVRTSSAR
jgi:hypothetical protein